MKNLGIAFLAAMTIASFGCKKKGDVIGRMTEFKDKMCKCTDKACVDKVEEEETKAMQEMAKGGGEKEKGEKPDDAMMKKMTDIGMAKMECKMKASGGGGAMAGSGAAMGSAAPAGSDSAAAGSGSAAPAAGSAAPAATGDADMSAWPQECKDYKAAVDNMMKCDKMAAGRDAQKQAFDSMTKAWSSIPAGPAMDAAMKAAATGCKGAADGIATSMKAMGC